MRKRTFYKRLASQGEKVLWITFFWTFISIVQFLFGYSILSHFECDLHGLSALSFLGSSLLTGITAGLIGGSSMVLFWEKWLRSKSYARSLLYILLSYSVIFLIVTLITGLFFHTHRLHLSIFHLEVWRALLGQVTSVGVVQNFLLWLIITLITLIILLVNDKYGPGVFKAFIMGKYFQPKREERIFMFLDIRGSTSIAEKLGEVLYFSFLRDVITDVTPKIIEAKGEIYQYAGDEIVITWKLNPGLENVNCLQCFLDIQKLLLDRSSYYQQKYKGIVPEYKAGLHYGHVMVGEIGIVKRDIAYSGDVLNTAARIQSKCNELGVNILVSKHLLDKLGNLPETFTSREMGEIELRGKEQAVTLFAV